MAGNGKDVIVTLRRAVEHRLGHGVSSPNQFKELGAEIERCTGRSVSVSTLMRLWGYVNSDVNPNVTTLDTLAAYAGFRDYASITTGFDDENGSDDVMTGHINVDEELKARDHVMLRWQPGRECLVRYMGGGQWVVERSERTKLVVGDTFTCHLMVQGHPLYLDNLVHNSQGPRCYVCGQNHGVHYEVIKADEACDSHD